MCVGGHWAGYTRIGQNRLGCDYCLSSCCGGKVHFCKHLPPLYCTLFSAVAGLPEVPYEKSSGEFTQKYSYTVLLVCIL